MDKISIILPSYNEEESIPLFHKEMLKIMKEMNYVDFELIFVNDGSKDKTLEEIRKLASADNRVRYISFSRNFGKEAGILAGLKAATGDYVATMDVDLQDPPEFLIEMYKILQEEDYDCVGLKSSKHNNYGVFRKFFTGCYYKIISFMSDVKMVSGARDFRLMSRQMVDSFLELAEYNRYSKGLFSFIGYDTKWLEYEEPDRIAGTTKWNFRKLFMYALEAIVSFSTKPLILSAVIGFLFCLIAFIMIAFIIVKTIIWGDAVGGWPSLACIIFLCSGLQMFFLGVIGEYLSKMYTEIKKRPIYIVKETEENLKKAKKKSK